MAKFEDYRAAYAAAWSSLVVRPERKKDADHVAQLIIAGSARYKIVEARTGVPYWFVGLCHYRESSCDFSTYLGNGESLKHKTTLVPAGRGPFASFVDGAVDALTIQGFAHASDWSIERTAYRLEGFNGYGYHAHGVFSPYLVGGSNLYGPPQAKAGKYVHDRDFDPNVVDPQLGTLVVLKSLCALDPSIAFAAPAASSPHEEALEHGIAWAQGALNTLGADPQLSVDGKAGKKTMAMLALFQRENGIAETGLLDAATIAALDKHLAQPSPAAAETPIASSSSAAIAPVKIGQDITDALRRVFG